MYTVEIYRSDRRVKAGERLVLKKDYDTDNRSTLEKSVKDHLRSNERYEFTERYDTPYYCSPSSETYWSM